jgi:hypothetical protein
MHNNINDATAPWIALPSDDADKRLAAHIDYHKVNENEKDLAYGAEVCDFCKCELDKRALYVDGKVRSGIQWANMCANCFEKNGVGIGWGLGQIYARQPNGDWWLVAGFQNDDSV